MGETKLKSTVLGMNLAGEVAERVVERSSVAGAHDKDVAAGVRAPGDRAERA